MPNYLEGIASSYLCSESMMPTSKHTMPHIKVTHPCAPDSPSPSRGVDNPIFFIEDETQRNPEKNNEHDLDDNCRRRTPSLGSVHSFHKRNATHSLPVTPTHHRWDRMSFASMTSYSLSDASSSMAADKGLFIYEKIHAIVIQLAKRAIKVKERIVQPPTPSSLGSRDSFSLSSLQISNRRRFESLVTYASSLQTSSRRASLESNNPPSGKCKRKWQHFCQSFGKWTGKCVDPQSKLYILWLAIVSVCYLYNACGVILRASFPYQTPENLYLWLICDYVADLFYLIDLLCWKPRIKVLQDGFWVRDPKQTARIYFKSWNFVFDLISLLPLDLFYFYIGNVNPLLRLTRIIKINTFWEFFNRFDRIAKLPFIIRVIHTLSYMLFLIHVNACAYYVYSDYEGIGRPDNVWVYNGEGNAYVRCFLFATKIATSIGKNPSPTHEGEYLFMTVSWLSGVFIFAMLIGQIRDIVSVASKNEEEYRKVMDRTLEYMKRLDLLEELHNRARLWFTYNWQQQKSINENKSLCSLPRKMQMDIAMHVHYHVLSKVKLFQDFDRNLLRELVLKLRPYLYLPGDYICKRGEVGKEMYIVTHGVVEVMGGKGDKDVMATLVEGSVFGEVSLLSLGYGNRRMADVRSKGFSNLFVLGKVDLHATIKDYPLAQEILRQRAKRLIKNPQSHTRTDKVATSPGKSSWVKEILVQRTPPTRSTTPKLIKTVLEAVPPESLAAHLLKHGSSLRSPAYSWSAPPYAPSVIISTSSPNRLSPEMNDLSVSAQSSEAMDEKFIWHQNGNDTGGSMGSENGSSILPDVTSLFDGMSQYDSIEPGDALTTFETNLHRTELPEIEIAVVHVEESPSSSAFECPVQVHWPKPFNVRSSNGMEENSGSNEKETSS